MFCILPWRTTVCFFRCFFVVVLGNLFIHAVHSVQLIEHQKFNEQTKLEYQMRIELRKTYTNTRERAETQSANGRDREQSLVTHSI